MAARALRCMHRPRCARAVAAGGGLTLPEPERRTWDTGAAPAADPGHPRAPHRLITSGLTLLAADPLVDTCRESPRWVILSERSDGHRPAGSASDRRDQPSASEGRNPSAMPTHTSRSEARVRAKPGCVAPCDQVPLCPFSPLAAPSLFQRRSVSGGLKHQGKRSVHPRPVRVSLSARRAYGSVRFAWSAAC